MTSGPAAEDPTPQRPAGMFAAFRERDFVLFLGGAFVTNAGGWFQSLAVPYVLFLLTGSPLWVGLAAAAQFVPVMLLGPWGGAIADAGNRRRVVMAMQLARSVIALAMFAVWVLGWHEPWLLLLLAVLTGCAQGISMPSWQSLVNDLVPRRLLSSAVSLNTIQFNLARSFGPAVGGLILYWWDPAVAFFLTFLAVLCVVVALLLVKAPPPPAAGPRPAGAAKTSIAAEFLRALRYIPTQPGIVTALVLVFSVGVLGMPIFQHVITFSEDVFDAGELGLTVLNLGLGVGTLLGIPALAALQRRARRSVLAAVALPAYGLAVIGFGLAPNLIWAALATMAVGLCFLLSLTIGNNTVQLIVADRFRGRVLALHVMIYTGSVALGAAVQGWAAELMGNRPAVVLAGCLLVAVAAALGFGPRRLRLGRLDDPHDTTELPPAARAERQHPPTVEGNGDMADPRNPQDGQELPEIDPQVMRQVMGSYPTGVVVVTGLGADGKPLGMVVGTFNSVSLDPPLVSFLPMKTSRSFAALRQADVFCINILAADQEEVCRALSGPGEDKFSTLGWRPSPQGAPILEGSVGWIECAFADVIEAGDHYIVLGAVQDLAVERDTLPLLFFQRGYGRFTPGSLMASDSRDFAYSVRRAECGRTEMEQLAAELGIEASLVAPLGDEFVFVATSSETGARHSTLPGTRLPFVHPLGMLMVDAPGAPTAAQWLERIPAREEARREQAAGQLERAKARGWSLTLCGDFEEELLDTLVGAYSHPLRTPEQERALLETGARMAVFHEPERIDPAGLYDVLQLSVPVRDGEGNVVLVLRLSAIPRQSTGRQILSWIHRAQESARFIEQRLAHRLSLPGVTDATVRHPVLEEPAAF